MSHVPILALFRGTAVQQHFARLGTGATSLGGRRRRKKKSKKAAPRKKSKSKKSGKPAWMVKGSKAAKQRMAKLRAKAKRAR